MKARDGSTTFVDNMRLPVHGWFRYSAGFSAAWVIDEIDRRGATRVLDPFAGSGTTLIAAQQAGAAAMGADAHPFVARVAQAKLAWTADADAFEARARDVSRRARPDPDPDPPALLAKCYRPDALAALRGLRRAIDDGSRGDAIDELLWLALVAILRPCSHVGTAQWQYVLPSRTKARVVEPRDAFAMQTAAMARDMRALQADVPVPPAATYLAADARTLDGVPDGWADLVLTSPPYANNYDYADATRLEMTFLGEVRRWGDLSELRDGLVRSCSQAMRGFDGDAALADPALAPIAEKLAVVYRALEVERATHGGRKAYHHMIAAYFQDLAAVWRSLRRVTRPGAEVCFVVGDSAPYGVHVPVERWLAALARAAGFEASRFEVTRRRNLKWKNRKHRVPLHEGRLWVR